MRTITDALHTQADTAAAKAATLRHPLGFAVAGVLAGGYVGVGVVLLVSVSGPLTQAGSGLAKLIGGAVFAVALTLVVFAGAELVTSAMMTTIQGVAMRALSPGAAAATLAITFLANLNGSFGFAALVAASGVLHSNAAAGELLADLLAAKAS